MQNDTEHPLSVAFAKWVENVDFPCIGAKAALAKSQIHFVIGRDFQSDQNDLVLHQSLIAFAQNYARNTVLFQSLVVLYDKGVPDTEEQFEAHMWDRINSLTDKDQWLGQPEDTRVSSDPDDPHFSLSFGGEAFFIIGLHPKSSRLARRFQVPAMVFNPHNQFEILRGRHRYEKMRAAILHRDKQLSGSVNPMLSRHGCVSEARQYSGRVVANDWQCPFAGRKRVLKNDIAAEY